MRKQALAALLLLPTAAACSTSGGTDPGRDAGLRRDGGGFDPTPAFEIAVLDPDAPGDLPIALAVKEERVGVAYFVETAGTPSRELRYAEPGAAPQVVAAVDRVAGLSLAFGDDAEPCVAFLGGSSDDESPYWLQSDLALACRQGESWVTEVLVRTSGEAASGVETSDFGVVVGLEPSLVAGPDGFFLAYRDVHGGQFPTDYAHSDLEVIEGRPGAWGAPSVAVLGANTLEGHGGAISAALTQDGPALAWSTRSGSATDQPQGLWFTRRIDGVWRAPAQIQAPGDTVLGPSLAFSGTLLGIAYEDRARGILWYVESPDGVSWSAPEPIFGVGTGGWHPSLAFGADGEPIIAYSVCSLQAGATVCREADDAVVLHRRLAGRWPALPALVDPDGGLHTKLALLQGERAVVAYRDRSGPSRTPGAIRLAVQR